MIRLAIGLVAVLVGCDPSGMIGADPPGPTPEPAPPPFVVCVNEFVASNGSGPADEAGERDDWIELHNPSTEAVSLAGWTISDDPEELDRHVFADGVTIDAGGFLLLWADDQPEQGPHHLGFGLDRAGGSILLRDDLGRGSTIHHGALGADRAAARATDCCEGEGCFESVVGGTPGRSNEGPDAGPAILLERGSTWRYLDTGEEPDGWKGLDFDDSGWAEGLAPLGFGDEHIATVLAAPATPVRLRATFAALPEQGIAPLSLRLLRDAGAVVYLNGVEIDRANLLVGPVGPTTWATRAVEGQEETLYFPVDVDPDLLLQGANQLAVELVPGGDGSDLGFDLELAERGPG